MSDFKDIVDFIRSLYPQKEFIPLHEPFFHGNERKYVLQTIDSTFVSSVGPFVDKFEEMMASVAQAKYAIATVNGTSALHLSLILAGVKHDEEVMTQALTFVATANAISYIGAHPVFLDVDLSSMGLSPDAVEKFLSKNIKITNGQAINSSTGRRIAACLPMHTFGFPCEIDKIVEVCNKWNIPVIEDAAEAIGSKYKGKHVGSFGQLGVFSFNGNKTVTCGGGGAIVTNDSELAKIAKHLTTQAKIPHKWEFKHDLIGYNYRLPNINAALACAQLEQLDIIIKSKRELATLYSEFFHDSGINYVTEPQNSNSNYWLNTVMFDELDNKLKFLEYTNDNSVMTRPIWSLMTSLTMFEKCQNDGLLNSRFLSERVVNIPSSARI